MFRKRFLLIFILPQVTESTTIHELKQKIEKSMNIPVAHQKLLCTGRTLVDDKIIGAYPAIKDGTKLTLVIKEPEPLKDIMLKMFKRYYTDQQSEEMTKEFLIDFEQRIRQMSLDDIERMATYFLERDRQLYGGSEATASI